MDILIGLLFAVVIGELLTYWIHRLQHTRQVKDTGHVVHHLANEPRSWLLEFWSYVRPGFVPTVFVVVVLWWLVSERIAVAWGVGMLLYMAFTAYVHELYHTNVHLIFWMRPTHHFHHNGNCRCNFGFTSPLMDRLFDTYKDDPTWVREEVPLIGLLRIKWI